jgi:hypothetical protein
VGGILVVGGALANVAMNNAVDDRAGDIQRALRNDLVAVSDEALADYPESRDSIESRAVERPSGTCLAESWARPAATTTIPSSWRSRPGGASRPAA